MCKAEKKVIPEDAESLKANKFLTQIMTLMQYECTEQMLTLIKDGEGAWCVTCRARSCVQFTVLLLGGELAWSVHVNSSQAAWISLDLTLHIGEMLWIHWSFATEE